jgi:hypothetical protein
MLYTIAKENNAVDHLRHLDHLFVNRAIPT